MEQWKVGSPSRADQRIRTLEARLDAQEDALHELAKQFGRLWADADLEKEERKAGEARFAEVVASRVHKLEKSLFDVRHLVAKTAAGGNLQAYVSEVNERYVDSGEFLLQLQGRGTEYRRGPLFGGAVAAGDDVVVSPEKVEPQTPGEPAMEGEAAAAQGTATPAHPDIVEMKARLDSLLGDFASTSSPAQCGSSPRAGARPASPAAGASRKQMGAPWDTIAEQPAREDAETEAEAPLQGGVEVRTAQPACEGTVATEELSDAARRSLPPCRSPTSTRRASPNIGLRAVGRTRRLQPAPVQAAKQLSARGSPPASPTAGLRAQTPRVALSPPSAFQPLAAEARPLQPSAWHLRRMSLPSSAAPLLHL